MEYLTDRGWWISVAVGSLCMSVIAAYIVRYLDRGVSAFFTGRAAKRALRSAEVQARREEMIASATAKDREVRYASWLLGQALFLAAMSMPFFSMFVAAVVMREGGLWLFCLIFGALTFAVGIRSFVRYTDLVAEIEQVDRQLLAKERGV